MKYKTLILTLTILSSIGIVIAEITSSSSMIDKVKAEYNLDTTASATSTNYFIIQCGGTKEQCSEDNLKRILMTQNKTFGIKSIQTSGTANGFTAVLYNKP